MKVTPLLFSAPMVRALIAGTKTQTRRIVKGNEWTEDGSDPDPLTGHSYSEWLIDPRRCRYGKVGDLIYVRESGAFFAVTDRTCGDFLPPTASVGIGYRADHPTGHRRDGDGGYNFYGVTSAERIARAERFVRDRYGEWIPSMLMPRWASRLTLRITSVRAQQLQAISEGDAQAEGARLMKEDHIPLKSHRRGFESLWESINGPGSYDANPWVWAISFEVIKANVDQVIATASAA